MNNCKFCKELDGESLFEIIHEDEKVKISIGGGCLKYENDYTGEMYRVQINYCPICSREL